MNRTRIQRCANHECPNKPTEGTFTVTTIVTREGRPRNITLALCGPCSDYLQEVRDDLVQRTRSEVKQAMYAAAYGASPRTIERLRYPKLTPPPHFKEYLFIGGVKDGKRLHLNPNNKSIRIPRPVEASMWIKEPASGFNVDMSAYDEYHLCYWYSAAPRRAFVHDALIGIYGSPWKRA
jgi:hypothetical protein